MSADDTREEYRIACLDLDARGMEIYF